MIVGRRKAVIVFVAKKDKREPLKPFKAFRCFATFKTLSGISTRERATRTHEAKTQMGRANL